MSTGRWGDEPSDHQTPAETAPPPPAAAESGPPRRKKLALKPRGSSSTSTLTSTSSTAKSSIFGAAKPREEVLASKGIDAKLVDERITKKATAVHYTREQNEEIQAIQAELTRAEADLRHANENELPEASFQKVVDTKRRELHELMELYQKENESTHDDDNVITKKEQQQQQPSRSKHHHHYERPSERRKRLEAQQQQQGMNGNRYDHHEEEQEEPAAVHENAFEHFGGKQHRHHKSHSHRGDGRY